MKKIVAFLFVLTLLLSGCSAEPANNSDKEANEITEFETMSWDNDSLKDTAKQLLTADKLVTDLFVGGKLTTLVDVSGKNALDFTPATGTEYEDFSVIEQLLSSTYSEAGGTITKYLTFPKYGNRSILSIEGKTYFSFHYSEEFTGIDVEEITISDGEFQNTKKITAGIYTIPMVYDGSIWQLEDSVYFLYKEAGVVPSCDFVFTAMNQGSAKALTGRVLVVEIFITDTASTFTEDEITAFDTKIQESFQYIASTSPNGSTFEMEFEQRTFKHTQSAIGFSSDDQTNFDLVLAKTTYEYLDKYITDNFETQGYDSYLAVLCVNKTGTGYAKPYVTGEADVFYAERCVLFPGDDKINLARNILALFGAQTPTEPTLVVLMENYCKNDIMRGTATAEETVISELTAYQAGVNKLLDQQFFAFCVAPTNDSSDESIS